MSEPLDLLAIMAHPDDAELLCGGALIKAADEGKRVGVLDLTAGEMGSRGSAEIRAREAARAAEVMGLAERRCLGLPDSALENDNESRHALVEQLRELRPSVVITHWKVGRHRDHRIASELVRDACFLSGLKRLDAHGDPFRPRTVVYACAFREDLVEPRFVVDVTAQIDRKLEAMACYESQWQGITTAGEVFPGGDRALLDQVRVQLAHYGSRIRVPYGEPFWTDEILSLGSLTELSVSTF